MRPIHTDVEVGPGPARGRLPGSPCLSREPALPGPPTRLARSAERLAKREGCWGGRLGAASSAFEDREATGMMDSG